MTRRPFHPDEVGRDGAGPAETGRELEAYAA